MDDRYFMKMALQLARKGRGHTSPNPLVGAVLVKDGTVVGKGYHKKLGGPHAEIEAIRNAKGLSGGATLYVNLEPCNHFGRTAPCSDAILEAGIKRVVIAMRDPNPDVKGGGAAALEKRGVAVTLGICREDAEKLNEAFIKYVLTRRPFVTAKCAATLDGRIATRTGDSKWVSGERSRRFVHRLRHASDAVMVGISTVIRDDPSLTARLPGGKGSDPIRIILDTHLSIPETAKVLQIKSDSDTLLVVGEMSGSDPKLLEKRAKIEQKNVKIIQSPVKNNLIDLDLLMNRLGAMGISSLLIEGGSRVLGSALSAGIVDKIFLFYAPKILGDDDGIPICKGMGPESMAGCIPVTDIRFRRFDEDVMIEGYIGNSGIRRI
ncbi:MAG: riboflavin biosynthesis protein RibD [Deltaproteobacteria bacterium RBG_13_49_15]|nr:MAG: riboflavin biosynthesis protein RibD [Deltaproteobacteria bacterium RBG_13_49_15]